MRLSLSDLHARHAEAVAAGDTRAAVRARGQARTAAAREGVPPPPWSEVRREPRPDGAVTPRHAAAPLEPLTVPDFARRWVSATGNGACAHVNAEGLRLSFWDPKTGSGERVSAFIPHGRFKTENAAAYALAQGAIRFAPARRGMARGVFQPRSGNAPSPPRLEADPALSDDAA